MSDEIIVSNKKVDVVIDKNNGLLKSIRINGKSVEISQNFYYYTSSGNLSSGAYVMHTNSSNPTLISPNCSVSVIREEIAQEFNPWLSQVIRLYRNNSDFVEFDWIVRPFPVDQDMEIITRFDTKFKS
jgi:lysosomal alpha-mannosidase